jgi:hypothetical protein
MRKITSACIAVLLSALSTSVHAHVKWFVANEGLFANSKFTLDAISLWVVLGAVGFLVVASWAEFNATGRFKRLLYRPWLHNNYMYRLIQGSVLILLLGNIIQGHFIAPNIPVPHHSQTEPLVQALLIILLVYSGALFSLATLFLCGALIYIYGFDIAIDYVFELAAIALAVGLCCEPHLFIKKFAPSQEQRFNYALTALRFGLGLQLCILTIHDKLLHPGLALQFLAEYPYFNFMRLAGLDFFSDIYFVLGAGLAEFCFGILLITNIAQRLASSCICFFFLLSGLVLGPAELLGHIPIFTAAIILLVSPAPALNLLKKPPLKITNAQI